jgi:hypothetical protein
MTKWRTYLGFMHGSAPTSILVPNWRNTTAKSLATLTLASDLNVAGHNAETMIKKRPKV